MIHISRRAAAALAPNRMRLNGLRFGAAILLTALGSLTALPARSEPYRLVPDDKIALRIVEWHSGEGEFKDWDVLNGTFLVNDAGEVSIPIVGEVSAAGSTTKELAEKIADLLQQNAGLSAKPYASVEVAQYGPVYLVGGVDKPGPYPFAPGLTVMKAISLAGGLQRRAENTGARFDRDRIQASSTLGNAQLDLRTLLVRQARLRAEMEDKDTFEMPKELVGASGADALYSQEINLMKLRSVELKSKIAAADGLTDLYTHSIETLQNKIETQQHQIDLLRKELGTVNSLVDKGLSLSSRRLALDQSASDAESKLLDLEFQLISSRQSLEENKRDAADIVNSRNSQIQSDLNDVNQEIAKSNFDSRISRKLMDEADQQEGKQLLDERRDAEPTVKLHIARAGNDGKSQTIEATADMLVEPRDLIEVETLRPDPADLGVTNSTSPATADMAASGNGGP
ncbi:polysaccharide biosynthesis/export family protein [Rhizobium sp. RAF56]|uniref:polysaccharide biosynthesis/export family protein n=1 Tax=Rhizobium sp. RAF56 TaxID=3233062 RepID=UPI003F99E35B